MNLNKTLAAVAITALCSACGGGGNDANTEFGGATISPVKDAFNETLAYEIKTSANLGGQTAYCSSEGAYALIKRDTKPGLVVAFGCISGQVSKPFSGTTSATEVADFTMIGYGANQPGVREILIGFNRKFVESVSTLNVLPFDGKRVCINRTGMHPNC